MNNNTSFYKLKTDTILPIDSNNTEKTCNFYQREIKIASLNIDTGLTPEIKYKGIFPDYNLDSRMPGIKTKLNSFKIQQIDIIAIQEARVFNENEIKVDAVTPIVEFLKINGYINLTIHYNNLSDNVFQFITALDATKFEVISNERIFFLKMVKIFLI